MGILKKLFEKDPAPLVLDYILDNPDDLLVRHHIEKETGLSYATVERVIYDLVEKGVIIEEEIGERKVYRLNKKNEYAGKLLELFHGRKLVESSPDGLFLVEKESGEIVDVNKGGEKLLNLPREEIVDKKYTEFALEESSQKLKKLFEKFTQEEKKLKEVRSEVGDLYIIDGEDNKIPIELSGGGKIDIGGLELTQLIVRDISKRKRAEERFRRLFNSIPDAAFLLDKEGIIREVNEIFHKKRNLSEEEIIGTHFKDLPFVPEESQEKAWENFQKRLSGEEVEPYTLQIKRPDGKNQVSEINASVLKDGDQIVGVIGVARDVTERVQAEEKFRQLFQGFPDPAYLVNEEAIIEETNEAACEHLGLEEEEIIGSTPLNLVEVLDGEEEEEKMMERFEKVKQGGEVPVVEHKMRTRDGEVYFAELNAVPLELHGEIQGVLIITHLITERKKMEKKLRESEKKYREIAENAHDLISFVDFEGKILYANQTHEDMLGYKPEELVGDNILNYHHPEDLEKLTERFSEGLIFEDKMSVEARIRCKDGSYKWVSVFGNVFTHDETGSDRILLVGHDITKRKEVEEKMRENKEMYQTIIETAPEAITITDLEGKIEYCSPRTAELHGYEDPEDLVDKSAFDFVAPEDREQARENLEKTFDKGVIRNLELTLEKKDGSHFPANLSIGLVKDDNGDPDGFVAIVQNIRKLKRAEKKFEKLFEALPVPAYLVNKEGKLEEVNEAASERLGVEKNEMIGKVPFEFVKMDEEIKEEMWENFQKVINGEKIPKTVRKIETPDGRTVYSELTSVPFKLDGEIIGATFISRDVEDKIEEKQN